MDLIALADFAAGKLETLNLSLTGNHCFKDSHKGKKPLALEEYCV